MLTRDTTRSAWLNPTASRRSFIAPFGSYCCITMPFGLKNASATYQRAMQRCLHDQLGRNVETYVNDVIIKSWLKEDLISNLSETFTNLRCFRWKLNPEKCIFGVPSGNYSVSSCLIVVSRLTRKRSRTYSR